MPVTKWDVPIEEAIGLVAAIQEAAELDDILFRILDLGGASRPYVFATHVLDAQSYAARGKSGYIPEDAGRGAERFNDHTWTQMDMCETPWPYDDNYFDVIWCTQTIEDVRDPIGVLREMSRIGKTGYIQTIDRNFESLRNAEDPSYAGYVHHRWLIEPDKDRLQFTQKYPLIHVDPSLAPPQTGNKYLSIWWTGDIIGWELTFLSRQAIVDYFKQYVEKLSPTKEVEENQ